MAGNEQELLKEVNKEDVNNGYSPGSDQRGSDLDG